MRDYSFELEVHGNVYKIEGKPLPLTKSLWIMQKLASLLAPLLAGLEKESQGGDISSQVFTKVFSGDLSEEEISKILSVLSFGLKATGLNDPAYQNFELVAKNGDIAGLEMLLDGDTLALFELGKKVLKENYGDMGKFLTRLSSGV